MGVITAIRATFTMGKRVLIAMAFQTKSFAHPVKPKDIVERVI